MSETSCIGFLKPEWGRPVTVQIVVLKLNHRHIDKTVEGDSFVASLFISENLALLMRVSCLPRFQAGGPRLQCWLEDARAAGYQGQGEGKQNREQ